MSFALLVLILGAIGLVNVMARPSISGAGMAISGAGPAGRTVAPEVRGPGSDGQRDTGEHLEQELAQFGSALAAPRRSALDLAVPDARVGDLKERQVEDPGNGGATPEELREFADYVDATLAVLRAEEAADRERDIEKRRAALDGTLRKLQDKLELTPLQTVELRTLLRLRLDREAEYVWHTEQGVEDEDLDKLKAKDREIYRRELASILTPEQLKAYRD